MLLKLVENEIKRVQLECRSAVCDWCCNWAKFGSSQKINSSYDFFKSFNEKNEKNWDLFFLTLQDLIKSVEKVLNFEGQFGSKDFQPWLDISEIDYFYLKVSYIFIDVSIPY